MSDTEFTPGPWFESLYLGGVYEIRTGTKAWPKISVCGEVYSRENAMLISAAPDLYDALQDLLSEVELLSEVNDKDYVHDKTIQSANLALAKARGGRQ